MNTPATPPEPFNTFMLDVGDGHQIYVEESGNPDGLPIVSFHGGPGSHSKPKHRVAYDLDKFRLILFDQRCGGQSTPWAVDDRAAMATYSPATLVADAEQIRTHLGLDSWHVTGGSWGSTLALLYAITYPAATCSLTLRALWLGQHKDWAWMAEGARLLAPSAYQACAAAFPGVAPSDLMISIAERILTSTPEAALQIIDLLLGMEHGLEILTPPPNDEPPVPRDERKILNTGLLYAYAIKQLAFAEGWATTPIAQAALRDKPFAIVHGGCDAGCPVKSVYDLAAVHPHAQVSIAANAGHGVDLDGNYARLYGEALARLTEPAHHAAIQPTGSTPAAAPSARL